MSQNLLKPVSGAHEVVAEGVQQKLGHEFVMTPDGSQATNPLLSSSVSSSSDMGAATSSKGKIGFPPRVVVFDFDCTLSGRHMFHILHSGHGREEADAIMKSRNPMKRVASKEFCRWLFADGETKHLGEDEGGNTNSDNVSASNTTSSRKNMTNNTTDSHSIRSEMVRDHLQQLKDCGCSLRISSFGVNSEIRQALTTMDLLHFFDEIHSPSGGGSHGVVLWSRDQPEVEIPAVSGKAKYIGSILEDFDLSLRDRLRREAANAGNGEEAASAKQVAAKKKLDEGGDLIYDNLCPLTEKLVVTFVDDDTKNYSGMAGYPEIRLFKDKAFKKNGDGLTTKMFDRVVEMTKEP